MAALSDSNPNTEKEGGGEALSDSNPGRTKRKEAEAEGDGA